MRRTGAVAARFRSQHEVIPDRARLCQLKARKTGVEVKSASAEVATLRGTAAERSLCGSLEGVTRRAVVALLRLLVALLAGIATPTHPHIGPTIQPRQVAPAAGMLHRADPMARRRAGAVQAAARFAAVPCTAGRAGGDDAGQRHGDADHEEPDSPANGMRRHAHRRRADRPLRRAVPVVPTRLCLPCAQQPAPGPSQVLSRRRRSCGTEAVGAVSCW